MNKERRKIISGVSGLLEEQKAAIEELEEAERGAVDNLPDSLQDSEQADAMSTAADFLEEAIAAIDEAISALQEAEQ